MKGLCADCGQAKPSYSAKRCWDCHQRVKGAVASLATGEKTCTKCGCTKPLDEFHRFANARDGHRAECKTCALERAKANYKHTPKHPKAMSAECRHCGEPFQYERTTGPLRVHCSEQCRYAAGEAAKRARAKASIRACACGSTDVQRVGKPVCPACRKDPRDNENNRARERARILRLYNISQADYDRMAKEQGDRCAICATDTPGGRGESWSIDHDHACCGGKGSCGRCVRGLLCSACNLFIGYAGDDPNRLRSAAAYLEMARQPPLLSILA